MIFRDHQVPLHGKLTQKQSFWHHAQLHSIQVVETSLVHLDIQDILSLHHTIFQTPQGLPPSHDDHDHSIPLISGSIPPNVFPYHHPFVQKNEIEKIVQELLGVGFIHPSTSPYYPPVVMVLKKEGTWCICIDFCAYMTFWMNSVGLNTLPNLNFILATYRYV
jgi:hypothetical protein